MHTIFAGGAVEASFEGRSARVEEGRRLGPWTLMAVLPSGPAGPAAVFEDFTREKGRLLFADGNGVQVDLPKSLEPTSADPATLYRGHRLEEVLKGEPDLLGDEVLARPGDPDFDEVAPCFPPIAKMRTYTFVGTPDHVEKVGFQYGGASPNFDPAVYVPAIEKIRDAGRVLDGLVGGWLPVLRFVYPEKAGDWTEMLAFAPFRVENGNDRVQPVWYRMVRVEGGRGPLDALLRLLPSLPAPDGGEPWAGFDPARESIALPPRIKGTVVIEAGYR